MWERGREIRRGKRGKRRRGIKKRQQGREKCKESRRNKGREGARERESERMGEAERRAGRRRGGQIMKGEDEEGEAERLRVREEHESLYCCSYICAGGCTLSGESSCISGDAE